MILSCCYSAAILEARDLATLYVGHDDGMLARIVVTIVVTDFYNMEESYWEYYMLQVTFNISGVVC